MENNILISCLVVMIKEYYRFFGVIGAVFGAVLVIYYCGSIGFYPSGLNIADTLFFLWAVLVFSFYYSIVSFVFFMASVFWVSVIAKPMNFILKFTKIKDDIVFPLPKTDWLIILAVGFVANLLIFGISYLGEYSRIAMFSVLILISVAYVLIDSLLKTSGLAGRIVDSNGKPLRTSQVSPRVVASILCILVYLFPLFFAQVGGGVTKMTFETMGIRQIGVTLYVEAKEYKSVLEGYASEGLISGLLCNEVCSIKKADILFTSIGTNTKLELSGDNGKLLLVLPTKAIKLVALPRSNKLNDS